MNTLTPSVEKDTLLIKLKQMRQNIRQIYEDSKSDESFESDIIVLNKIIRYNRKKTNYHLYFDGEQTYYNENAESMIAMECIYNCFQNLNERIQSIENIYAAAEAAVNDELENNGL